MGREATRKLEMTLTIATSSTEHAEIVVGLLEELLTVAVAAGVPLAPRLRVACETEIAEKATIAASRASLEALRSYYRGDR
jgi:hypothetical protein